MDRNADVLVVGAGPVGLLLAAELARDGVKVLIIDGMVGRTFFSKALGVTSRTLEIFDDLGVLHEAVNRGVWLRGVSAFSNGEPAGDMDIPDVLPLGNLSLAQFETERILEACLHRHGSEVHYGWSLAGFHETAEGVEAALTGPGGEKRRIDCRWLAGCDGAHSRVRSTLGVDFAGGRFPQTFALADLEVEWDLPHDRMYRFYTGAPGQPDGRMMVALPVQSMSGRRFRLSTVIPETGDEGGTGETTAPDLNAVAELMGPLLPAGTRLSSLYWSSIYRISHRIAAAYSRGRVFLAGDAAHIHPPVGGQGMNTGLQDAHNLAWKLTLAARGLASPSLLATYEEERRPVGLDVVENTSHAMKEVLGQRTPFPGLRETQLLIAYRESSIVRDDRGDSAAAVVAAGDRAPDAGQLRRRFMALPFRLHELLGKGRHVLLAYHPDGEHLADFAALLSELRNALADLTGGYAILARGSALPVIDRAPWLSDDAGEFAQEYGATPGMAWLIRPDGHVAWCSERPTAASLREYLRTVVV